MRARILTTVGDSTSQKFLLIGQIAKKDQNGQGKFGAVFLDFAVLDRRKCTDNDFETWTARSATHECLMGHKVGIDGLGRECKCKCLIVCCSKPTGAGRQIGRAHV